MKKWLNLLLVIFSLPGYLEWGGNNSIFLAEIEWQLLTGAADKQTYMHPFVAIPLLGQLLLLITLFQKTPSKWLTYAGMLSIGILLLFMLVIGVMSGNMRELFSAVPFLATAVMVIVVNTRKAKYPTKVVNGNDIHGT